jgi:hypothetical protein
MIAAIRRIVGTMMRATCLTPWRRAREQRSAELGEEF